jgi:hypothetical protein
MKVKQTKLSVVRKMMSGSGNVSIKERSVAIKIIKGDFK